MRKYVVLKEQFGEIKKLMIYDTGSGVYLFFYKSVCEDDESFADEWYENINAAINAAKRYGVYDDEWKIIDDPMDDCQHDIISPIRVKGRGEGKPQWGKYEKLVNGVWVSISKVTDDNC